MRHKRKCSWGGAEERDLYVAESRLVPGGALTGSLKTICFQPLWPPLCGRKVADLLEAGDFRGL